MYPNIPQSPALSPRALFSTPGIREVADFGSGRSRGVLVFSNGVPYRVIGQTLLSVDEDENITTYGTITGSSNVSMASNGINIAIQDPDGDSFFFTPSSSLLELNNDPTFASFGQARTVTFKDGFYVYTTDSIFFTSSNKTDNDGKSFNALDFEDAEINPDIIIAGHNNHNQEYILGTQTTEVYQTIETTGFPLQRIPGATIQKGCKARNSVIEFDDSFVFVGGGEGELPGIWRAKGSTAEKISNSSIEQLIQKNTEEEIADATAFSYAQNGNYFAVFTIGSNTFVYDAAMSRLSGKNEWHERQTGITDGNGFLNWRAVHGVLVYGEIQVADDRSGKIGVLDFDTYTEYGERIERFFSTSPFSENGNSIFNGGLELAMQVGVGDETTPDPQVRMDYTDTDSNTFVNEIWRSMGAVGEYETRVRWSRLGRIPNRRTIRFKCSEAVTFDVYGLYPTAEVTSNG